MQKALKEVDLSVFLESETALPDILPELAALHGLVERNDWHDDDPFEQTMRLWRWLRQLPGPLPETVTASAGLLCARLSARTQVQDRCDAHDLLCFAALIHDVGKAKTYEMQTDGTTRCPGHEAVSGRMAKEIGRRFDFTLAEKDLIVRLVAGHGEPYALFKRIMPLPELEHEQHLRRSEAEWGDDLLLLLLLAYGDLVTSHLSQRRPEKYAAILAFYEDWLRRLVGQVTEASPRTDP